MQAFWASGSPPLTQTVLQSNSDTVASTSASDIISPPLKAYSVSHQTQRKGQPVRRTKTVGKPTRVDSPWTEWKISLMRSRGSAMTYYLKLRPGPCYFFLSRCCAVWAAELLGYC